jgi:putative membrane protein
MVHAENRAAEQRHRQAGQDGDRHQCRRVMMTAVMLGFWALVAWVIISLTRGSSTSRTTPEHQPSANAVLDQRFARGEIDEDEYRRRKDALRSP